MKAHRLKTKLTTKEEIWNEWNDELNSKIINFIDGKMLGSGVIKRMEFYDTDECKKGIAAIKLDLIKEWESRGRNVSFLKGSNEYGFMDLLQMKHFGKNLF